MRGTHGDNEILSLWTGIIPAYAGNTYVEHVDVDLVGDHPRVCGEHMSNHKSVLGRRGSSPRMRGTPILPVVR